MITMLSPKIIHFNSMKNLIHTMRDMNITDSLKASVFDEKFHKVVAFGGLGKDRNISLAIDRHMDYSFHDQMKTSVFGGSKDYVSVRKS